MEHDDRQVALRRWQTATHFKPGGFPSSSFFLQGRRILHRDEEAFIRTAAAAERDVTAVTYPWS